ncbi:MAG: hypothetical protein L3J86_06035 [Thermoplasmata archaeon]|nr:hypothetical protein [Thermoplasmata archaeon]
MSSGYDGGSVPGAMTSNPAGPEADREARRISRQRKVVGGLGVTFVGIAVFLLAPDLTGPLVQDLPYFVVSLGSLYVGGILLGVGFGERRART